MIRLLRRLGRFPAGTETDYFDAAAEAAFLLDGTAERLEPPIDSKGTAGDYEGLTKGELLKIAADRGVEVRPRAAKREIAEALSSSDEA